MLKVWCLRRRWCSMEARQRQLSRPLPPQGRGRPTSPDLPPWRAGRQSEEQGGPFELPLGAGPPPMHSQLAPPCIVMFACSPCAVVCLCVSRGDSFGLCNSRGCVPPCPRWGGASHRPVSPCPVVRAAPSHGHEERPRSRTKRKSQNIPPLKPQKIAHL